MAVFSATATLNCSSYFHFSPKIEMNPDKKWRSCSVVRSHQNNPVSGTSGGSSHRRVWRRRKLAKKDTTLDYKVERVPFLEEQVRKLRDTGTVLSMDIERLLLSEDNRFDFVNEVAREAKQYVEKDRDEYGFKKKAILHVLSNRMNDAGFYRPEAYIQDDPFKPGPGFLRRELYDQT